MSKKTKFIYQLIKIFNRFMILFMPLFPFMAITVYLVFRSAIPHYCDQGTIIMSLLLYFGATLLYVQKHQGMYFQMIEVKKSKKMKSSFI